MPKLKWTDSEELALRLLEKMPEQDPLAVRFTDLRDWVCQLEDFGDDPQLCNEAKLEAIQMAWLEERQEAGG
ncbi:MAG: hypothetical protein AMXMBFR13_41850 [Phycisphaerae bacterium]